MPAVKNKLNLTDLHIRNTCVPGPNGKRATYTDAAQPGLVLLVTGAGRKTFYVVRRPTGSDKPHWYRLGDYCDKKVCATTPTK
jgi:hypothetical protein